MDRDELIEMSLAGIIPARPKAVAPFSLIWGATWPRCRRFAPKVWGGWSRVLRHGRDGRSWCGSGCDQGDTAIRAILTRAKHWQLCTHGHGERGQYFAPTGTECGGQQALTPTLSQRERGPADRSDSHPTLLLIWNLYRLSWKLT